MIAYDSIIALTLQARQIRKDWKSRLIYKTKVKQIESLIVNGHYAVCSSSNPDAAVKPSEICPLMPSFFLFIYFFFIANPNSF